MTSPTTPGRLVLIGHPVAHTMSPAMQNAALAVAGIPLRYESIDVGIGELGAMIELLREANAAGNVTRPHKSAVFELADVRTALAERVGAVNTFWFEDGRLHGDNTDVAGFDSAVEELLGNKPSAQQVVLFGAGGAAAAVLAAVSDWGDSSVTIVCRTPGRAERLAARFPGVAVVAQNRAALRTATLAVNATPIGLSGVDMPCRPDELPSSAAVFDLVYLKGGTPWVLESRERGMRAAEGTRMLIEQGAAAFQRWFGVPADKAAMEAAL